MPSLKNPSADPRSWSSPKSAHPTPGLGEVLVRVKAAGINPVDAPFAAATIRCSASRLSSVGWDISGTVEAVGPGVHAALPVGDEVFGMPHFPAGGRLCRKAWPGRRDGAASRKPRSTSRQARCRWPASRPGKAWSAGGVKQGQRVLIHAAAGGVGHLAVQIAKARGAYVVATASPEKLDFVRALGADEVIDYTKGDFAELARDIDIALEPIGGDQTLRVVEIAQGRRRLVSLNDISEAAKAEASDAAFASNGCRSCPTVTGLVELAQLVDAKSCRSMSNGLSRSPRRVRPAFLATRPIGKVALDRLSSARNEKARRGAPLFSNGKSGV